MRVTLSLFFEQKIYELALQLRLQIFGFLLELGFNVTKPISQKPLVLTPTSPDQTKTILSWR